MKKLNKQKVKNILLIAILIELMIFSIIVSSEIIKMKKEVEYSKQITNMVIQDLEGAKEYIEGQEEISNSQHGDLEKLPIY